jgi:hypothetical protein
VACLGGFGAVMAVATKILRQTGGQPKAAPLDLDWYKGMPGCAFIARPGMPKARKLFPWGTLAIRRAWRP